MSWHRGSITTLVVSAWVACGSVAWGQAHADDQDGAVEVRIGAVVASNSGQAFDQRLIALQRQFASLFHYSSYRLIREERRRVAWKRQAEFNLPGGRFLLVMPREYKDGRVSLSLMLAHGTRPLVNTAFALRNHGTFLVAGPHHEDGVLIIAIGASTTR